MFLILKYTNCALNLDVCAMNIGTNFTQTIVSFKYGDLKNGTRADFSSN